jgi:hydrogenase nickel incorporation protein HypA/HybF
MHELSLVMNVLQMAETEAVRHHAEKVEAVRMEIGFLSGVEMDAFSFAWEQATPGTALDGARLEVTRTEGTGCCRICNHSFPVEQLYNACPRCGSYDVDIEKGKELRVQSLVLITH